MADEQTGELFQPKIELPVDKMAEKLQSEFYTLSSDNIKLQQEYYTYKTHAEDKLSTLQAKNAKLRSEVQTSASAIHTIYQEMSEVLVQNRIIAGNNHHLLTEKTELETKLFGVEQSESRLQALISANSLEFSKQKQILLGELNSMKKSNEESILELNNKIQILEEDVQMKNIRNENLQHELAILQKCDLDFILKKRAAITGKLRRKFCSRVNINKNEKARDKVKKIIIAELKANGDGEINDDGAEATEKILSPGNEKLDNSILQWTLWKGKYNSYNPNPFPVMQSFCASTSTNVAETIASIPGEDQHEVFTLSDFDR